jgi:predicted dehydrogenase
LKKNPIKQGKKDLITANKELVFQNEEKDKRAAELIIANKELVFQKKEKQKRAEELLVADKELVYQKIEKGKRAAELIIADKELIYQNEEKEKRAAELIIADKEANIKFQVGHVERFNPAFLVLNNEEVAPMFIEVHRLAQFNPRGTDVSVILDLMIHDIDIILKLVKSNVKTISANGVSVMSDTPDIANVRVEFDNGCVANLTSSRISIKKMRKMRLFQKNSYISIDFLEKKTEITRLKTAADKDALIFDIDTNNGKKSIAFYSPKIEDNNAIKMELESFKDAILNNTTTIVSEVDGFRAMEVAHLILEKIAKNK